MSSWGSRSPSRRGFGPLLGQAIGKATTFWAVVAWTQVSGLSAIASDLRELRRRGGSCSVILGVDGGIATKEGLSLAVELFDPAVIFHDTGSRFFHPKVYCVEQPGKALLAVAPAAWATRIQTSTQVRLGSDLFSRATETFIGAPPPDGDPARETWDDLCEEVHSALRIRLQADVRADLGT